MVFLASCPDRSQTTRKIAGTFSVSETHLSKVLQRLARAGLVKSIRGPRGGFSLGRPGESIHLLEVFELIEGNLTQDDCLLGTRVCTGENCIFGGFPGRISREFREYLARTRLTDLVSLTTHLH